MFQPQLRIYYGPQEEEQLSQANRSEVTSVVNVPLREVLPLLVDAVQSRRTWLKDFEHEEITLSLDLYEVLLAYQHHRRPSA
jgi:type VI protein secretion system component VasK